MAVTSLASASSSADIPPFWCAESIMVDTMDLGYCPLRCTARLAGEFERGMMETTICSRAASKGLFLVSWRVTFQRAASRLNRAPGTQEGMYRRKGSTSTRYLPGENALSLITCASSSSRIYWSSGESASIPYTTRRIVDPKALKTHVRAESDTLSIRGRYVQAHVCRERLR